MTAERDRLAAALHEAGIGCVSESRMTCGPLDDRLPRPHHVTQADRLIAAGVVLIGDHDAEVFRRGWERGHAAQLLEDRLDIPADLDVERLARAIDKASEYVSSGHGHPPRIEHQMWATGAKHALPAIASAYREDAG